MALRRGSHMATWVDLDRLSPSVLRHLAAAKERASRPALRRHRGHGRRARRHGHGGRRPTIGWYRRHRIASDFPT